MTTPTLQLMRELRNYLANLPAKPGPEALAAWWGIGHVNMIRLLDEIDGCHERMPREPFDVRAADALADEVYILVQRHVIDARSPAADALLDYRAAAPRADRIMALEHRCDLADRAVQSARERMAYLEGINEALRDFQFKFSGEYVTGLEKRVTELAGKFAPDVCLPWQDWNNGKAVAKTWGYAAR